MSSNCNGNNLVMFQNLHSIQLTDVLCFGGRCLSNFVLFVLAFQCSFLTGINLVRDLLILPRKYFCVLFSPYANPNALVSCRA